MAGGAPRWAIRPYRASRTADVNDCYSSRPGRIRPATMIGFAVRVGGLLAAMFLVGARSHQALLHQFGG